MVFVYLSLNMTHLHALLNSIVNITYMNTLYYVLYHTENVIYLITFRIIKINKYNFNSNLEITILLGGNCYLIKN